MSIREINFDGIVGPSHNYGGLSLGNLASARNLGKVSYPRAAALQGLDKMRANLALGLTQGVLAMVLSRRYLLPLSFAWSTPGAALLITAVGAVEDFAVAVGAFLSCGC